MSSSAARHSALIAPGTRVLGGFVVERAVARSAVWTAHAARRDGVAGPCLVWALDGAQVSLEPPLDAAFAQAAEGLAALAHPGVPTVLASGVEGGTALVATADVPGTTLAERLAQSRQGLELGEALCIVVELAEALDYLHSRHPAVVHATLEPSKVLLANNGAFVRVREAGFAHALRAAGVRHDAALHASRPYRAPEADEPSGQVLRAVDQFALASIAYACLTGRPPADVYAQQPSLANERPDLPAALDAVLRRAWSAAASARYPTAGVFAAEVERALRGFVTAVRRTSISAPPPPRYAPSAPPPAPPAPIVPQGVVAPPSPAAAVATGTGEHEEDDEPTTLRERNRLPAAPAAVAPEQADFGTTVRDAPAASELPADAESEAPGAGGELPDDGVTAVAGVQLDPLIKATAIAPRDFPEVATAVTGRAELNELLVETAREPTVVREHTGPHVQIEEPSREDDYDALPAVLAPPAAPTPAPRAGVPPSPARPDAPATNPLLVAAHSVTLPSLVAMPGRTPAQAPSPVSAQAARAVTPARGRTPSTRALAVRAVLATLLAVVAAVLALVLRAHL